MRWEHYRSALTVVAIAATPAGAHADGLDAERFRPTTSIYGGFAIDHAAVASHLGWGVGLFANFADDPVVVVDGNDDVIARPVDSAVTLDLVGAIAFWGRVELGVHLPVHVVYDGDADVTVAGSTLSASGGVGDVWLVPKVNLLRAGDAASHTLLAIALPISLPTGDAEAFRGAGGVTLEPKLLAALYVGPLGILGSVGYHWRSEHPAGLPWGDELTLGLGVLYELSPVFTIRGELFGGKHVSTDADGADFPLELLGGIDYRMGDLGLHAGATLGLVDGIGAPDFRVIAGVRYRRGAHARRGYEDRDNDGVKDHDDAAPDEPEDEDGFQDDDGAPEPDNDGDGVPDEQDECPEIAEEPGGDKDGCPEKTYVKIIDNEIVVFGKVRFRTGSAEIDKRSEPLLDQLGQALTANPQVKKVRIEGHTDSVGDAKNNQELSDARARAVKSALESRDVDGDRLQPVGYGEARPAAPNKTAAGRAKNRRVEFVISER